MTMVGVFFGGLILGAIIVYIWTAPPLPGEPYAAEISEDEYR